VTPKQREVLAHIVACYKAGGPLPSGEELMERFGWSSSARPFQQMLALEADGAIRRATGSPRYGIVLSHPVVAELMGEP